MQVDPRARTSSGADDAVDALQADLDRLRLVVENLPVVSYTMDRDGSTETVTYVSGGIERLTGYPPEEWIAGELWYRVVHPDDLDGVVLRWDQLIGTGAPYECEYRMVRRDGSELWVREKAQSTMREDRTHVDGIFEDVTERRLAQDRLAAAEQRTRDLVEQVPAILYEELPGAVSVTSYVSPQIAELLGVSPEEYIEDKGWWVDHLHPDERDAIVATYDAQLTDPAVLSFSEEYRLVRPDGRTVWINDRSTIIRNHEGAPVLVRGGMFDVTSQKLAEAQVADAEIRYRTLVEQLPLIAYLWEIDPAPGDDTAYFISPQIETILGYSAEDWNEDPEEGWREMIHPEDRDRIKAASTRSETTGEPFVEEYRYLHKADGRPVWVHDESVLLRRTDEGRPWLFQGIMYDITDRVEAEARLKSAEEQYRTLVERMPAVTYVWDARATQGDNRNYTSPQIRSLLGYTPEEWESRPDRWQASLHPEDRGRVLAATSRAVETGEPWTQEFRYIHRDGRTVWVHDEAAPSGTDDEGRPRLFEGVMFDITERVEADVAFQESLARFQALAHNAPVGIFENDPEGNCTFVNDRWCEVAGTDAVLALGTGWTAAIHPDDRKAVSAGWASAVASAQDFLMEFRFRHTDEQVRWVTARAAAVTDAHGVTTGFVGTIEDMTERRATEEQLRLIRSAVEHTGHAVMVAALSAAEIEAPVVYVNPAFTTMSGYEAAEAIGRPTTTFFVRPEDTAGMRDRLRGGLSENVTIEMVRKDGSRFVAEGVISPIRDAAGTFSNLVVILRDVTEIREIEHSLRESLDELRLSDAVRRTSLAQIVEAQEQELDRMAEGIEDSSIQHMSAVRIRMETLRRNLSDPAQLGALEKLEASVDQAVGQLRGLVSDLRPRELATEGLGGAIREHLARADRLRTEVVGALREDPDASQEATAFRVVQEALVSALEDRAAGALRVELEDTAGGFSVRIVDDGASWTTVGSSTMQDRAGLAGGRCRLVDGPDGATVELWLPLRAPLSGGPSPRPS